MVRSPSLALLLLSMAFVTLIASATRMSRVLWNLSEHDDGQRKDGRHGTELRWVEPENRQQGCMA